MENFFVGVFYLIFVDNIIDFFKGKMVKNALVLCEKIKYALCLYFGSFTPLLLEKWAKNALNEIEVTTTS